jgi:hypothetical protein
MNKLITVLATIGLVCGLVSILFYLFGMTSSYASVVAISMCVNSLFKSRKVSKVTKLPPVNRY